MSVPGLPGASCAVDWFMDKQPPDHPQDWKEAGNPSQAMQLRNRFFQRGGVWVIGQGLLLGAIVLLAVVYRGDGFHIEIVVLGIVMMVVGAGVALAGAMALGRNLTPFPKPSAQAQLVRHGIYAMIRHPLYTSVITVALGWALAWQSWPALLVAVMLIPFFSAKARREEHWLREKFPEYAAYEQRVRRFIPGIY